MKVNHDRTKKIIIDITDILRAQAQVAKNFKVESDKVTENKTYSQAYQAEKIDALRREYDIKYNGTKDEVAKKLEEILNIELENEQILEFDVPEFANTLAAINAAKGKLPENVISNIKLNFAGQYQALLTIAATFENYGVEVSRYGYDDYLRSVSLAIEPLIIQARNIERSEVSTAISLKKLLKNVIHFGEVRGITFSENVKTLGDGLDDDASNQLARRAMGLS